MGWAPTLSGTGVFAFIQCGPKVVDMKMEGTKAVPKTSGCQTGGSSGALTTQLLGQWTLRGATADTHHRSE
jgi:hypothetical protein